MKFVGNGAQNDRDRMEEREENDAVCEDGLVPGSSSTGSVPGMLHVQLWLYSQYGVTG